MRAFSLGRLVPLGVGVLALLALAPGRARAQFGFGFGFGGYYYNPAFPEPYLFNRSLQMGSRATMGPVRNFAYQGDPNNYMFHLHDDPYSRYDVATRREIEARIARFSDGPPPSAYYRRRAAVVEPPPSDPGVVRPSPQAPPIPGQAVRGGARGPIRLTRSDLVLARGTRPRAEPEPDPDVPPPTPVPAAPRRGAR